MNRFSKAELDAYNRRRLSDGGDAYFPEVPIDTSLLSPPPIMFDSGLGGLEKVSPSLLDPDQVTSSLRDMEAVFKNLAEKSRSASFSGTTQQVDPARLDRASDAFNRVYQQLMRRGLI